MLSFRLSALACICAALAEAQYGYPYYYSYGKTLQQVAGAPTQWNPDFNRPDKVQVTSVASSASTTTVETPTPASDAPWDVVTAAADGEGYVTGDYLFPLSPEGEDKLTDLFSQIEAACGLPVKRDLAEGIALVGRQSVSVTECARDFIAESEVAAWDAGFSTSLVTITAGDAAIGVQGLSAAALVVLSAWILGNGKVPQESAPVIQSTSVGLVDDKLVNPDDGDEEDDPPTDARYYQHTYEGPSEDDIKAMADSRISWQQTMPYAMRNKLRDFPGTEPTCQQSDKEIPLTSVEGTPDASSSIMSFCKDNAGTKLDADQSSVWDRLVYDDHSYWLVASIWAESPSSHCGNIVIDEEECSTTLSYASYKCDTDSKWLHGSQWQGECVNYTMTVDAQMTRESPPSWEEAGSAPEEPEEGSRPEITNSCAGSDGNNPFTVDQAQKAVDSYCSADRTVDVPLIGGDEIDGVQFTMVMQKATAGDCPSFQTGYKVTVDDCKSHFMGAVNNCDTGTTTEKYGNKPLTWLSPAGCIDFTIYAPA